MTRWNRSRMSQVSVALLFAWLPFGKLGNPLKRLGNDLAQLPDSETRDQRVDWLARRQLTDHATQGHFLR